MVSSFFSKSKPINFIVVALYMTLLYIVAYFQKDFVFNYRMIFSFVAGFILYIISMFVINTITQKNDLTHSNTYTILLFVFFTTILPQALTNWEILFANLMVLIGLKNVLGLRNGKFIKAKVLNASLCIGLASLTYFWSLWFFIIIFLGIIYFEPKNYRNWCIPVVGLLSVYLLATCFTLLFFDSFFYVNSYFDGISFSFQKYEIKNHLLPIGILLICIFFFVSVYILKFKRKAAKTKPVLKLIIAQLLIAVFLVFWVPEKNTSELLFITAPLAIIGTTYMEMDQSFFAKEVSVWVFLLLPLITILI